GGTGSGRDRAGSDRPPRQGRLPAHRGGQGAARPAAPPRPARGGRGTRCAELLAEAGPAAYEDEGFGVHFAFFALTDADVRLRILEGRRRRVEERRDGLRAALARTTEKLHRYTLQLPAHRLDTGARP